MTECTCSRWILSTEAIFQETQNSKSPSMFNWGLLPCKTNLDTRHWWPHHQPFRNNSSSNLPRSCLSIIIFTGHFSLLSATLLPNISECMVVEPSPHGNRFLSYPTRSGMCFNISIICNKLEFKYAEKIKGHISVGKLSEIETGTLIDHTLKMDHPIAEIWTHTASIKDSYQVAMATTSSYIMLN